MADQENIAVTNEILKSVKEQLDRYIQKDEERYDSFNEFRSQCCSQLSEISTTMRSLKNEFDNTRREVVSLTTTTIPTLKERQSKTESSLSVYNWFIKGLVGLTIIASLGGIIGSVNSCDDSTVVDSAAIQPTVEDEVKNVKTR